ncbi:MAG: helix-turn-helix domain-containing protein [Dehalococcoidia bacterium]
MPKHVALRSLTRKERGVLRKKVKDLTLAARVHQRYRIVDLVSRGHSIQESAEWVGCHFTVAYDWVHRFNESGFTTFERVSNPRGRPPILKAEQLRELVEVALSSPSERGLPFSAWSIPKLTEYCRSKGVLPDVTDEWVRRLLRREGLTPQRIRTWKTSRDPDFDRKKNESARSTSVARRARR